MTSLLPKINFKCMMNPSWATCCPGFVNTTLLQKDAYFFLYFWLYNVDIISANKIIQKWVMMPKGVSTGQISWAYIFFQQI